MSASIWSPNSTFISESNATGTIKQETQVAVAAQVSFILTTFAFVANTGTLLVFKNGDILIRGTDYTEVSNTGIVLTAPALVGDEFLFIGYIGLIGAVTTDPVLRADLASLSGSSLIGFIASGTGAVLRALQEVLHDQPPNCKGYGAIGDGVVDDTAAIQRALDTLAVEVYLPPGRYKTTSTLFLRQNQTLRGPRRTNNNNFITTKMATIVFSPVVADTCISNAIGTDSNGIEDIQLHGTRNDSFGAGFLTSYANKVKRVGFTGTFDVGIYMQDTYVCEIDEPSFTGTSIKHNCLYIGTTNSTKIRRLHTSTLPNDATVCMVGIAVAAGKNVSIEDCVFQGPTVGIHLYGPYGTVISNPYFENCVCNIKGDSVATAYSTNIIGGIYSGPYVGHSQYASRGPLIYSGNMQGVDLTQPNFLNTNVTDANIWPILMGSAGGGQWTISGAKYTGASGGSRAQIFRELAGTSPSLSVLGEVYGANGATEIILKDDGAFGGLSYGIRVNNTGVISTTAWTPPAIATAVPALIKTAFYVPVMP